MRKSGLGSTALVFFLSVTLVLLVSTRHGETAKDTGKHTGTERIARDAKEVSFHFIDCGLETKERCILFSPMISPGVELSTVARASDWLSGQGLTMDGWAVLTTLVDSGGRTTIQSIIVTVSDAPAHSQQKDNQRGH